MLEPTREPPCVAVADDEIMIGLMIQEVFLSAGYDVSRGSDGDELLSLVEQREPVLIVTNWSMPGTARLPLLRRLRATFPHVPIIVVTGDVFGAREASDDVPDIYVLGKPIDFPHLFKIAKIRGLIAANA